MTKQEAIGAMRQGLKITHRYFSSNEWVSYKDGRVLTEEGYLHHTVEFWNYRQGDGWSDGYSIWEAKT